MRSPPHSRPRGNGTTPGGFTLVEVLVALAIVAIALMAALRAAGMATTSMQDLRGRLLAGWVADNRLAEHRARGDWLPLGSAHGRQQQGGIEFAWREDVVATPNAAFRRVDIVVHATDAQARELAHVSGFVVNPPAAPP
jgi:general secretion pathway protein I